MRTSEDSRAGRGSEHAAPDIPLLIVDSHPEALFRVGRVHPDGPTMRASMPIGPWVSGPDGRISAGSLGVLIDDVLGYAIIAARPPDHWSVSTEITLDVFDGLWSARGSLHAEAQVVHLDAIGGFAAGKVFDDDGNLVAVCSQRGRFVRAVPSVPDGAHDFAGPDRDVADVETLMKARRRLVEGGCALDLDASPLVQNPMHNMHGGISLCVSDLAASLALGWSAPQLASASIHVVYARPIPGGSQASFAATVRHRGRSLGLVDVVGSVDGKPCTIARVTLQPAG